jgi:hypothetical protein
MPDPAEARAKRITVEVCDLSSFSVTIHLGVGLPVIGVGFLATVAGLLAAVQYFAGVVALPCLAMLPVLARARRSASTAGG